VAERRGAYGVGSGLKATDRYLIDGIQKVNDGDKVRLSVISPQASMKLDKLNAD